MKMQSTSQNSRKKKCFFFILQSSLPSMVFFYLLINVIFSWTGLVAEQLQVLTSIQCLQLDTDFDFLFTHIQAVQREKNGTSPWTGIGEQMTEN